MRTTVRRTLCDPNTTPAHSGNSWFVRGSTTCARERVRKDAARPTWVARERGRIKETAHRPLPMTGHASLMTVTPPARSPRRRVPRNTLNPDRILDAAVALLDRDGLEAFTMRALA